MQNLIICAILILIYLLEVLTLNKQYDAIIVGAGVSGLYCALNLDKNLKVLLICKRKLMLCNSALAQGGVASVLDKKNDSFDLHINDTYIAGGFKNNTEHTEILVQEGPNDVLKTIDFGVEYDKNEDGSLNLTLEGGHSRRRIAHHKDSTGFELTSKLQQAVLSLENVDVLENAMLSSIKKVSGGFFADVMQSDEHNYYTAPFVVFATGGIGRVYEYTTNSAIATGDGIAFAYSLGAEIRNLSLIQFHPTAFADHKTRECFLISEAVRGEGAYLYNCNGERFMERYDPRLELAPRDVVSGAIIQESIRTGSQEFYLDISRKDKDFLINRFPMIYQNLLKAGFDLTKEKIPIFPCHHYLMGGIDVDSNSQSSLKGLYAVGECSHTGVHGNNRLASNSLLEALVFSRRAANDINEKFKEGVSPVKAQNIFISYGTEPIKTGVRTCVRKIMQDSYFVLPNKKYAKEGFLEVKEILDYLSDENIEMTADLIEARSLATVAYLILKEII